MHVLKEKKLTKELGSCYFKLGHLDPAVDIALEVGSVIFSLKVGRFESGKSHHEIRKLFVPIKTLSMAQNNRLHAEAIIFIVRVSAILYLHM